jgi:hypothetical protein
MQFFLMRHLHHVTVAQIVPGPQEYGDARIALPKGTYVHLACKIGMEAIPSIESHSRQEHIIKMPGFEMLVFASIWGTIEISVHILSQKSSSWHASFPLLKTRNLNHLCLIYC